MTNTWKSESKSFSPPAQSEAVNLARALHLLILEARCPRQALRNSLVPEFLLRCRFCLLEVEKQVALTGISRTRAWQGVDSVLDTVPRRTRAARRCRSILRNASTWPRSSRETCREAPRAKELAALF